MNNNITSDGYELGRDATHLATASRKKETSVISVRLSNSEIARVEGIGRENGKIVSQVIRDAIAAYRAQGPRMVVGMWNGITVSMGEPQMVSGNACCDVVFSGVQSNFTGAAAPVAHN